MSTEASYTLVDFRHGNPRLISGYTVAAGAGRLMPNHIYEHHGQARYEYGQACGTDRRPFCSETCYSSSISLSAACSGERNVVLGSDGSGTASASSAAL